MQFRRLLTLSFALLAISALAPAQDVHKVDGPTLSQHIDHQLPPVYPPIAKAARIQGTVVIEVRVGVAGKVESMKVTSGPPMLQQAALDCLKQWTYRPFDKDGVPTSVSGPVSIDFSLGRDGPTPDEDKIASQFFPLSDQCRKAISTRDFVTAASICKQAAETAEQFTPTVRFIEKRSAFVYAATAFADNGDLKTALDWAAKAVQVVKLGNDDASGNNAAYSTKGTIEGMSGDLAAADQDLTAAEDYERKGIVNMEKDAPSVSENYKRVLARDLRFHAQVLQRLNRPDDAQKKLDEAAKYN